MRRGGYILCEYPLFLRNFCLRQADHVVCGKNKDMPQMLKMEARFNCQGLLRVQNPNFFAYGRLYAVTSLENRGISSKSCWPMEEPFWMISFAP